MPQGKGTKRPIALFFLRKKGMIHGSQAARYIDRPHVEFAHFRLNCKPYFWISDKRSTPEGFIRVRFAFSKSSA